MIKDKITSAPVLRLFDPSLNTEVWHDSSGFALGATLYQKDDRGLRPVTFLSRKFNKAEKEYPVHEQELLGFVHELKKWRHYLLGRPFTTTIDHQAQYLQTQKHLSLRQARWLSKIQEFDFTVHIEGKRNIVQDALSRRPDLREANLVSTVAADPELLTRIPNGP